MNIPILIAFVLTLLAFFVHTIQGDREIQLIRPSSNDPKLKEKWVQARCGWHWVSFDLLMASIGMGVILYQGNTPFNQSLIYILVIYFAGYGLVWLITVLISPTFPGRIWRLGQWVLLWGIGGLLFWGRLLLEGQH